MCLFFFFMGECMDSVVQEYQKRAYSNINEKS